jgi:hypothetical protein
LRYATGWAAPDSGRRRHQDVPGLNTTPDSTENSRLGVGIGVALKPRIFACVVAAWLLGIIVNLLLVPGYYDIALRDAGLCLSFDSTWA